MIGGRCTHDIHESGFFKERDFPPFLHDRSSCTTKDGVMSFWILASGSAEKTPAKFQLDMIAGSVTVGPARKSSAVCRNYKKM